MNLYILGKDLEVESVVDSYKSLIWTDRYNAYGDFELYTAVNEEILKKLPQDYYLSRDDSEHVMIVESLLIKSDVEEGQMLTVTGRSLESILDRRIIWGQKELSGNLQNGIEELLYDNIIQPANEKRKIDNFVFEPSDDPDITKLEFEAQYTGDSLYDVISSICSEKSIGFKVTLNEYKQFVFRLYSGIDRSYDQTKRPYVMFSPNFDNLISGNYVESKANMKNATLVGGEGEGSSRRYLAVGNPSGLERRETFTDARDVSSDINEDISGNFLFTTPADLKFTNLIPKSLNDNSGWNGGSLSEKHFKYETASRCLTGTKETSKITTTTTDAIPLNKSHRYYVRVEVYQEKKRGIGIDVYWPISETSLLSVSDHGRIEKWNMLSTIADRKIFETGDYPLRLDLNNNFVDSEMWFDGMLLVDLTETFGEDAEISLDWLDKNIPWFEKDYTYKFQVEGTTVYRNKAYNVETHSYVDNENFDTSKIDVSKYAGRKIQITIPKYNNANGHPEPYGTVIEKIDGTIETLQSWEQYDGTSYNKGALGIYEFVIPFGSKYLITSMYSQKAIDSEIYYGELNDFECSIIKLSDEEYHAQLRQKGDKTLSEKTEIVSFEGQAETTVMFKYGDDFFIGDIVQISDDYGHETKSRVVELVTSDDEEGYTMYPTFSTISNDALPTDYLKLEYIESTGTQWIDTMVVPNIGYIVEIIFEATYVPEVESWVIGLFENIKFRAGLGLTDEGILLWSRDGFSYNCPLITLNNKTKAIGKCPGNATLSLTLFGQHEASGVMHVPNSKYRLYSCKIYDETGSPIRNFSPCKNEEGIVGLFDKVEQKFYKNSGTGEFLYG